MGSGVESGWEIHSALQSAGVSSPIAKRAGALKAVGRLSLSQTKTFQWTTRRETRGKPAYSTNKADYDEAGALLKSVRKGITLFSSSGYINDMANGSICLALGWNGDMAIAANRAKEAKKGVNLEVLIPKNGAVLFFDTMAIPKDAKNVENAHKFIDYMLRPEVQAEMFNTIAYRGPIRAADKMIEPARTANKAVYMTPETEKLMVAPGMVGNDIRRVRTRMFTSFKTGL